MATKSTNTRQTDSGSFHRKDTSFLGGGQTHEGMSSLLQGKEKGKEHHFGVRNA
jgi:hypothetical protein